jgi:hypothetical protein
MTPKTKNILIISSVGVVVLTALIIGIVIRRRRKKVVVIKDGYTVPKGTQNMADALHSFERRKSDGFGGRMSTKIKEALVKMYEQGINPDVTDLKVNVDAKNYKVTWEATIEPSKDGKAYTGFMTFGSAGSTADSRAKNQEKSMKEKVGGKDYKLVLDFVNPKDVYIRQYFYKYTKDEYPAHK